MARPPPQVLLESVDPDTYKAEQVLAATAIYAVYHKKQPINLRTLNKMTGYPGPKYKKASFSNPGHALNLSDRLNKMFFTEDFQVYKLQAGELYTRE